MVTRLKDVDAVTVGLGWTGAIMARELNKAGLNVVALEKGQDRTRGQDFILPAVRDEVRYAARLELMWDNSIDTLTFRNFPAEQALPIRRIGAFLAPRAERDEPVLRERPQGGNVRHGAPAAAGSTPIIPTPTCISVIVLLLSGSTVKLDSVAINTEHRPPTRSRTCSTPWSSVGLNTVSTQSSAERSPPRC